MATPATFIPRGTDMADHDERTTETSNAGEALQRALDHRDGGGAPRD